MISYNLYALFLSIPEEELFNILKDSIDKATRQATARQMESAVAYYWEDGKTRKEIIATYEDTAEASAYSKAITAAKDRAAQLALTLDTKDKIRIKAFAVCSVDKNGKESRPTIFAKGLNEKPPERQAAASGEEIARIYNGLPLRRKNNVFGYIKRQEEEARTDRGKRIIQFRK